MRGKGESSLMESNQDAVFLIEGDRLLELSRTPYEPEDTFQEQLARHSQLVGGSQFPVRLPGDGSLSTFDTSVLAPP
jgi:hypothetical protein